MKSKINILNNLKIKLKIFNLYFTNIKARSIILSKEGGSYD